MSSSAISRAFVVYGTYAVVNENEKIVEIFTKKQEAEDFINKNQNI